LLVDEAIQYQKTQTLPFMLWWEWMGKLSC